jgi:hypothetical protein
MPTRTTHDLSSAYRLKLVQDHRAHHRDAKLELGILKFLEQSISCTVFNMSAAGAGLLVEDSTKIPPEFELRLHRSATQYQCEVCWQSINKIGVRFISTHHPALS